ncbi:TonB-dependent receptor [Nitrobacter sp.]|uniref:TonB-dependent receptor n=1 Tax=Nitrobacter sp. TaxID=29420 RepID=UPI0029CAAE77|nr:TonB-dependent receptor [Nitrobacter sp.]
MKNLKLDSVSRTVLAICGLTLGTAAVAQTSVEPQATNSGIQDIIVTASKREQRLQDIPVVVSAVTQRQLEANRIATTQDLQLLAPSLLYNELGGFAQPFLRGIGTDVSSPNVDPSVATYIDGAFLADSQSTIQNLLGVERIEVVSGPQGTLYGRNAVAGAINIITLTPKQDFESRASLSYGNFNAIDASARLSGGVSDTLAVGVYGAMSRRKSYYHRSGTTAYYAPQSGTGDRDYHRNWALRTKAVWNPVEGVRLTGSVQVARTYSPDVSAFRQGQTNATGFAAGAPVQVGWRQLQSDFPAENHNKQLSANLREEIDIGDHQLVGITAYNRSKGFSSNDLDGTSTPLYGSDADFKNEHFSQELQIVSPKGETLEYIVGVYFWDQKSFEQIRNASQILFLPATNIIINSKVDTRSYAAFAQATLTPVENLRLTLGGRYTRETKKAFDGYQLSQDPTGVQLGATTFFPDSKKKYNQFTPKVSVDYRIDGTLLYASYSKGFKSGVYNMASPGDAPVDPEVLTAYEIGSKSDFLDGKLRINLSAYYYNFKGLQVQVVTTGSGGLSIYQNADGAKAYGFEAAVTAQITPELRLTAQGAYEHTEYKDYPGFVAALFNTGNDCPEAGNTANCSVVLNAKGNQLQRAPKWVGTFAVDYSRDLNSGGKINANANLYYNGGYYWDPSNVNRQPKYALVNGSIGYTLPGDRLTVSAFGNNLFNKHYQMQRLAIVFGTLVHDGPPRTYGVSAAYKF